MLVQPGQWDAATATGTALEVFSDDLRGGAASLADRRRHARSDDERLAILKLCAASPGWDFSDPGAFRTRIRSRSSWPRGACVADVTDGLETPTAALAAPDAYGASTGSVRKWRPSGSSISTTQTSGSMRTAFSI